MAEVPRVLCQGSLWWARQSPRGPKGLPARVPVFYVPFCAKRFIISWPIDFLPPACRAYKYCITIIIIDPKALIYTIHPVPFSGYMYIYICVCVCVYSLGYLQQHKKKKRSTMWSFNIKIFIYWSSYRKSLGA